MKSVYKVIAVLLVALPSLALAGELVLDPGSRVTVTASETMTVTCSGSSSVGGSKKECDVVSYGNKNRLGSMCDRNFCGYLYQYGQVLESTWSYYVGEVAAWCDQKTAQ